MCVHISYGHERTISLLCHVTEVKWRDMPKDLHGNSALDFFSLEGLRHASLEDSVTFKLVLSKIE